MVTLKSVFYGSFLVNLMETIWNAPYLLQDRTFFVWKVGVMDALLNSCIWDVSSIVQLSFNIEQVLEVQKKRLELSFGGI
jgi:PI-3-kinase-related kinase SMG-1